MIPISTNILQRTFRIKYGESTGTCFTIDVSGRQYVVTARHVVKNMRPNDAIHIWHDNTWKKLNTTIAWISKGEDDIAILNPKIQLSTTHPVIPSNDNLILGQDVYFLGYPYGMTTEFNRKHSFPLVKKGIVSGFGNKESWPQFYIDGHNNPGFSGGPIVFHNLYSKSENPCIAGIISSYKTENKPLLKGSDNTGLVSAHNTGIIVAYGIQNGVKYITENPSGFKLDASRYNHARN